MSPYRSNATNAQPFRTAAQKVILHCIANADTPADMKAMILIALESQIITVEQATAIIQADNLD